MAIATGKELIEEIVRSAEVQGKIFIPDDFDEAIANSIINFAKRKGGDWSSVLFICVNRFMTNADFTFAFKDFANAVPNLFDRVEIAIKADADFRETLRQTQERMKES